MRPMRDSKDSDEFFQALPEALVETLAETLARTLAEEHYLRGLE